MSVRAKLQLSSAMRVAAWTLAGSIVVLSFVPPQLRPETVLPHKLEHFLAFVVTGAAFGVSYEAMRGLLALQLLVFSALVEVGQIFVPGRHARVGDFVIDAFGITAGSLIGWIARQFRPNWMS